MKRIRKTSVSFSLLGLILLFGNSLQAAVTSYVCPDTYKTVMTGYSMEQVAAACGPASDSRTLQQTLNAPIKFEQWVYTLASVLPQKMSQLTPQLLITFTDDQVTEIAANNQNASLLFGCYRNQHVKIGSKKNEVRQQCGAPTFINSIQRSNSQSIELTQWVYNYGPYRPQIIFIFQNGKLTEIKMGQLGK